MSDTKYYQEKFRIGNYIEKFKIIDIKRGHFSVVLVCLYNDKLIALKTINENYLSDKLVVDNFFNEVYKWLLIGNKNRFINSATTFIIVDQIPFLVFEYVEGNSAFKNSSLDGALELVILNEENGLIFTLFLGIQICKALEYVQEKFPGFVHRDIKPSNILISSHNVCKLSDIGLAFCNDQAKTDGNPLILNEIRYVYERYDFESFVDNSSYYRANNIFQPIEMIRDGISSIKTDIYSLGMVLAVTFEKYYFQNPYKDKIINYKEEIGEKIILILKKCIHPIPEARYDDFKTLKLTLMDVLKLLNPHLLETSYIYNSIEDYVQSNIPDKFEVVKKNTKFFDYPFPESQGFYMTPIIESILSGESINLYEPDLSQEKVISNELFTKAGGLIELGKIEFARDLLHRAQAMEHDPILYDLLDFQINFKTRNNEEIMKYYHRLINSEHPFRIRILHDIGVFFISSKYYFEAENIFRELIRVDPNFEGSYIELSILLEKQNKLEEALTNIEKAICINPTSVTGHLNLLILLLEKYQMNQEIDNNSLIRIKNSFYFCKELVPISHEFWHLLNKYKVFLSKLYLEF